MLRFRKNGLTVHMSDLSTTAKRTFEGRRRCWELNKSFVIDIDSKGLFQSVNVPKGFSTDFATIPIFVQLILGNRDDWVEAAVAHDWLCVTHVPYFICNSWMRTIMYCMNAPRWKRIAFFYGLMLFGYQSPTQTVGRWLKYYAKRSWKWVRTRLSSSD